MHLPSYPLITVDPYFSIWSRNNNLSEGDTELWCGMKKRLTGLITVDSVTYSFLGQAQAEPIPQTACTVTPFATEYTFATEHLRLKVTFWTPLLFEDLHLMSMPCSFVDYSVESLDGKSHAVTISLSAGAEFVYDGEKKPVSAEIVEHKSVTYARLGQTAQKPLSASGDLVSADWGYLCLQGGEYSFGKTDREAITATHRFQLDKAKTATTILAFDDIVSIEYFGEQLRGLWTERFAEIGEAITYCAQNREALWKKLQAQEARMLADAADFGEDYKKILTAAARQVLAAHKLVRNSNGQLLYLSKECNSNGCINTVDVSYPAVPMFLLYRPELVKAMLTGVFAFSRSPVWQARYAPHDIGTYPHADGQVYGIKDESDKRHIFLGRDFAVFDENLQMPVEECGNMLILSYAYYFITKDSSQMAENYDLLKTWADYLKEQGIVLQNQLCTDDFAGHSEKNVNLAIKSIMGLASFAKISDVLGKPNNFFSVAKDYAEQLSSYRTSSGYLPFSLDQPDRWSLKYNLVWDLLFDFHLFEADLYEAETQKYRRELDPYGIPIDNRKHFAKTDWMLWAACLDKTGENIDLFSIRICRFLRETEDKQCFSDWYDSVLAKGCGFCHRSVQGGLWMPVLKRKLTGK